MATPAGRYFISFICGSFHLLIDPALELIGVAEKLLQVERVRQLGPATHGSLMKGVAAAQQLKDKEPRKSLVPTPQGFLAQEATWQHASQKGEPGVEGKARGEARNAPRLGGWPRRPWRSGCSESAWLQTHPVPTREESGLFTRRHTVAQRGLQGEVIPDRSQNTLNRNTGQRFSLTFECLLGVVSQRQHCYASSFRTGDVCYS